MKTSSIFCRRWFTLVIVALVAGPTCTAASISLGARTALVQNLDRLPMRFEANHGLVDPNARYFARSKGYLLELTRSAAVIQFRETFADLNSGIQAMPQGSARLARGARIRIELLGARSNSEPRPIGPRIGKSSYFLGNNPARWRINVPAYGRVEYSSVYPGIDWVCHGNQDQFEYDFLVAPGADPNQIRLRFAGADRIAVGPDGGLIIKVGNAEIRQPRPCVYQDGPAGRGEIAVGYVLTGNDTVALRLGPYDPTRRLVIDPTLVYSTYFGGASEDIGRAVTVDKSGNIYLTGTTYSTPGAGDVFLIKLDPTGTNEIYSVYFGGSYGENPYGIAADDAGDACVMGFTTSPDFPTTNAIQTSLQDTEDPFVVKLNPSGDAFVFSTYLGSSGAALTGDAEAAGISLDPSGNIYVTGTTSSTNFPVTANAFQPKLRNDYNSSYLWTDAFVAKLSPQGALRYATYLGGNGTDVGKGIAVDSSGSAYVTGWTLAPDFPITNAFKSMINPSGREAFLTKLKPDGSGLVFSTFFGDYGESDAIALDSSNDVYLTGVNYGGLPVTAGAFQTNSGGSGDAYVLKFNPDASAVLFATFLGGNALDQGLAITANAAGMVALTGFTDFTPFENFPVKDPLQPYRNNLMAFVAKFDASGDPVYSTYLGGSGNDTGYGIAFDAAGNVLVTGETESSDFPTTNALHNTYYGSGDAFFAKLSDALTTNAPPPFRRFYNAGFSTNGLYRSFGFDIVLVPNAHYDLQSSTNLKNWTEETPFQADLQGHFHYDDIFAPSYPQKFYRVLTSTNSGGKQ